MGVCHVPYSVRLVMDVFRVPYCVSLAMDVCRVPYSMRLAMDVPCAIKCETSYTCVSCAI